MDVAIELVIAEGYDGYQMRRVAELAQVSTRTLYNTWSSKEHLLLAALLPRNPEVEPFIGARQPVGETAAERVAEVLALPTNALLAAPAIAVGITKALVSGEPSLLPIVVRYREDMIAAILRAISPADASEADARIARTLQRVWFAALVGWASGAEVPESIAEAIDDATRLLFPAGPGSTDGAITTR
jgi:AcrR family transcriptional regulator